MAYTPPVIPTPGTVITVAWATQTIVDNLNWFRAMTGQANPPGAGYSAESTNTSTTQWIRKLSVDGGTMRGDLYVSREVLGQPSQGYIFFGTGSGVYLGFDGTKHVLQTPGLQVNNDVTISRASAPTQGYIILGTGGTGHFFGYDGTRHVIDGQPIWFDGNAVNRVVTAYIADLNVTTPKIADGAVTTAKLASTVALVPSGVIALWNAAGPPAGWVIDSSYAGRTVIGAGGGFTLVATGGAVTHTHDIAHAHPQGTTESASGTTMTVGAGSTTAPATGHTHQFTAPSHGAGGLASQPGSSLPPYLVSNFIRKT